MAPQHFNLLFPSFSARSLTPTQWKPWKLSCSPLCVFHSPFALPIFFSFTTFVLLQRGNAVFSKMDQKREEGGVGSWRGGGEGRGRLPEGSALWLALSNWLMRKAGLCSWQAGDSSSWLRWYTYLGLKWRRWRREGLPSHCKGVKKEIRLLHIMPNEIEHRLMHMQQSDANTHNWVAWPGDKGPLGETREHVLEVHAFTPLSHRSLEITLTEWETTKIKRTRKLLFW